jgi:hypothetical protein
LGIAAEIGTRIGGLTTSLSYDQKLSTDLSNSMPEITKAMVTLQSQIESLAAVTLQNKRRLVLSAEKVHCLFLEEEYFLCKLVEFGCKKS